jgi:glutathione S-transferase
MLKLHGFAASNYYNMVKLALLEKDLPFEEVPTYPSQEAAFLSISPRGKVPLLQCAEGYLSETSAILEYVETLTQTQPLLPPDRFAQAQVRELVRHIELYIELPARACYAQAFFGQQVDKAILDKSREELLGGMAAFRRLAVFAPYVAGDSLSLADLYFLYSIPPAAGVALKLFGLDLLDGFPQAAALLAQLAENANVQRVAHDKDRALEAFMAYIQSRRGG